MSRHHGQCLLLRHQNRSSAQPGPTPSSQVATPKRMSRHQHLQSSFCLAQIFFFFSKPPVAFLLLLGCSSLTHCSLPTSKFLEFDYNPFPYAKTRIIFQNSVKPILFMFKNWNTFQNFFFFIFFFSSLPCYILHAVT